ncbi:MAG TPA: hypothetical protein VNO70_16405 [Blastocatellia bacterium]|nr:hypothetical protein [Blastocatellia bacterium]
MSTYRVETTVDSDGSITLDHLPFQAGDAVEVIIIARSTQSGEQRRYPLRGTVIRYANPTDPVAVEDWGALQ